MKTLRTALVVVGFLTALAGGFAASDNTANTRVQVTILGGGEAFHPVYTGNSSNAVGSYQDMFSFDREFKTGSYTSFWLPVGVYPVYKTVNGVRVQFGTMTVVDDGNGQGHLDYTP